MIGLYKKILEKRTAVIIFSLSKKSKKTGCQESSECAPLEFCPRIRRIRHTSIERVKRKGVQSGLYRQLVIFSAAMIVMVMAAAAAVILSVTDAPESAAAAVFDDYVNPVAEKENADRQAFLASRQSFPGAIRKGMTGFAVKNVNKRLLDLGYLKSGQDGVFTDETFLAVKAFQEANGLEADGVVGEQTFEELFG